MPVTEWGEMTEDRHWNRSWPGTRCFYAGDHRIWRAYDEFEVEVWTSQSSRFATPLFDRPVYRKLIVRIVARVVACHASPWTCR